MSGWDSPTPYCACDDPDAHRLELLVSFGWPQPLASLALWDRPEFFRRWDPDGPA